MLSYLKKNLRTALVFLPVLFSTSLLGQSSEEFFKEVKFIMHDSTTRSVVVDVRMLLVKNTLAFKSVPETQWKLKDVDVVVIDTTKYFVKPVQNFLDTVKLMELVILGKMSFYTSPRMTTNDEYFVEKGGKVYQLRVVRRYINELTFKVKEYASYLQSLTVDCKAINQGRLATDLAFSYRSFFDLVSQYNNACGWQEVQYKRKDLKPKATLSFMAGGAIIHNKLNYEFPKRFEGKTLLKGIFVGPSVSLDFHKFYDTRVSYDLMIERFGGEGSANAKHGSGRHVFNYKIFSLKQAIGANISVHQKGESNVRLGSGIVATHQLVNKTTWSAPGSNFYSPKDKFNLSPFANIHISDGRMGFRYQIIALSIQMKKTEVFGFEHRFSLHYDLTQ